LRDFLFSPPFGISQSRGRGVLEKGREERREGSRKRGYWSGVVV
jgi:hypothetical protein